MQPQLISLEEFQKNFSYIKSELEKGAIFRLMYGSQPIADIQPPLWEQYSQKYEEDEKKWTVEDIAGGFSFSKKLSEKLSPEYINAIAQKRYQL